MHMYLLHRMNFKVKLINCRLPQRMPWYVHNVSVKNEMVIHLCLFQIAYFEFNDDISCLCIVDIVFGLMPENGGGWGAEGGGPEMAADISVCRNWPETEV